MGRRRRSNGQLITRGKQKLNPNREPEINLPELPKAEGEKLRLLMEEQWKRGGIGNAVRKAKWKP